MVWSPNHYREHAMLDVVRPEKLDVEFPTANPRETVVKTARAVVGFGPIGLLHDLAERRGEPFDNAGEQTQLVPSPKRGRGHRPKKPPDRRVRTPEPVSPGPWVAIGADVLLAESEIQIAVDPRPATRLQDVTVNERNRSHPGGVFLTN
jgi:hypothetical protein